MLDDIDGVFKIDQCVEAITSGVLQSVFVVDALYQFGCPLDACGECGKALQQPAVAALKGRPARHVAGIQQGAVEEDDAHAGEGMVAVLCPAAAHATGIVGRDPTDLGGVNGCGIRTDLTSKRRETNVGLGTDHTRLQADLGGIGIDLAALPPTEHQQYRVCNGLPREAGTGGAKCDRNALLVRQLQRGYDLLFIFNSGNELWHQAVKTGVIAIGNQT